MLTGGSRGRDPRSAADRRARRALDLADDEVGAAPLLRIGEAGAQELRRALDAAERIPDLVREAGRDVREARQALGVPVGALDGVLQRVVVQHDHGAARRPARVQDGRACGAHDDVVAGAMKRLLGAAVRDRMAERRRDQLDDPAMRRPGEGLRDVETDRLRRRRAGEQLGRGVQVADDALRVDDDDAVRDAREDIRPAQAIDRGKRRCFDGAGSRHG
jgi:hypothetical protein